MLGGSRRTFIALAFAAGLSALFGGIGFHPAAADDKGLVQALRAGGLVIVLRHGATFADQVDAKPVDFDNIAAQRLAFYLAGGDRDPLIKSIADSRAQLQERKFPVVFREIKDRGREYFEDTQIREVARWIDSLDKL